MSRSEPRTPVRSQTVALLRAINVGGRTVTMARLREIFVSLGLGSVETYIASGNVIFDSPGTGVEVLARRIEKALERHLGFEVSTFLRSDEEIAALVRYQPFELATLPAGGSVSVGFLAEPLTKDQRALLPKFTTSTDQIHARGREIFRLCRGRQSESTFVLTIFERTLGVRATFRGMNTVQKLASKFTAH